MLLFVKKYLIGKQIKNYLLTPPSPRNKLNKVEEKVFFNNKDKHTHRKRLKTIKIYKGLKEYFE